MKLLKGLMWFFIYFYLLAFATQILMSHEPKIMQDDSYYKLESHIKRNEGYSTRVYVDTRGYYTVGYGHKLNKKDYEVGEFISNQRIDRWFRSDLNTAKSCARRYLNNDYTQNEFIVITDMAFNLGCTKLYSFWRLRKHINNHDYVMAAKAIRGSVYFNQVTKRALRNIRLIKQQ